MKVTSRVGQLTNGSELPQEVVDLGRIISTLSAGDREQLAPVFKRVSESARRRRHILGLVQEALSQLRLDMKYLLFDVEATRRERDELRQQHEGAGE